MNAQLHFIHAFGTELQIDRSALDRIAADDHQ